MKLVWGKPPSAVRWAQPGEGGRIGVVANFFHSYFHSHVTDDLVFHKTPLFNSQQCKAWMLSRA
jgi:hypothetical protein